MTFWESIILGVVEGLTEYLPVSSTGHIRLAQRVLRIPDSEAAKAFAICIQAGAIIAVLSLYFPRVKRMVIGFAGKLGISSKQDEEGFKLGCNIIVAFLPAAVIGILFDDVIELYLFGLWPIAAAWMIGGLAILVVARWRRKQEQKTPGHLLENLSWQSALVIGIIQCIAMWPGTSRSLVTIVGGVLVGLRLVAAVEFSFLLGVVTLLAATLYKAQSEGALMLSSYGWKPMLFGTLAAWLSAVVAVKWMVGYLKKNGMEIFGYYRVGLAAVVATCLSLDIIEP